MPEPTLPTASDDELEALAEISDQDVMEAQASTLAADREIAALLDAEEEEDA